MRRPEVETLAADAIAIECSVGLGEFPIWARCWTPGPIAAHYTLAVRLSIDLTDGSAVPYFLWDEPLTVDELRRRLSGDDEDERVRLAAKVMREARFDEAVALLPVADIVARYPRLRRNLGRRLAFWDFLIAEWRSLGLVS